MAYQEFAFKLVHQMTYKGVKIMLYNSTEGWFVETSQGLGSEYMKTKKEAMKYISNAKNVMKIEASH